MINELERRAKYDFPRPVNRVEIQHIMGKYSRLMGCEIELYLSEKQIYSLIGARKTELLQVISGRIFLDDAPSGHINFEETGKTGERQEEIEGLRFIVSDDSVKGYFENSDFLNRTREVLDSCFS